MKTRAARQTPEKKNSRMAAAMKTAKKTAKKAKKTAKKAPWPKLAQIIFDSNVQSFHRKKSNGVFVCYIHNCKRGGLLVRVRELVELVRVKETRVNRWGKDIMGAHEGSISSIETFKLCTTTT
jgi:hypothetical protein